MMNLKRKDLMSTKYNEKYILVSSPEVTEILKSLVEKAIKIFPNINVPNLADYSTKFEDIK